MSLQIFALTLTLSLLFVSLPHLTTSVPTFGATFSAATTNTSLPPSLVPRALESLKLTAVRLEDSDPNIIRAFSYTNTTLLLTIPNSLVPPIAGNVSSALNWLYIHVVPFYPRSKISTISVGNSFQETYTNQSNLLLSAIRNIHLSLNDLGINKISVSTTFSFVNVISNPFPPSSARFQQPVFDSFINPLLQFLKDTNSSFLINLYPYNLYRLNSEIPIGYALFQEYQFNFRDDMSTGVRYRNLFDMMLDAVICAMAVAGHENIPVIVTETGWPSSAVELVEVEANRDYAEMYFKGLLKHLIKGFGTPLSKEGVSEIYVYDLFDEDVKDGNEKQRRHWGIIYPNLTKKYDIEFSGSCRDGILKVWILFVIGLILFLQIRY